MKTLGWGAALTLVMIAGMLFFFYHRDVTALGKFTAAYEKFDAAVSDQSVGEASDALDLLGSAAQIRLSSAIKNDGRLMQTEHEIADFSWQEVGRLRAYKTAIENQAGDRDALGAALGEITAQRKAAYARFRDLLT